MTTSLSHTWSLAVEEHFYLAMCALVVIAATRKWTPARVLALCLTFAVAIEVLRTILVLRGAPFYFYTHTRADALLLGVALACIHLFYPRAFAQMQRQRWLLLLVVAFAIARLSLDSDARPEPNQMTSPILITAIDYASAALLLLLYRPGRPHNVLYRAVAKLGVFSYGIYLWHVSVIRPVDMILLHTPNALSKTVSTLLPYLFAIIMGVAATKAVELPLLRLRDRIVPARVPEVQIPDGKL